MKSKLAGFIKQNFSIINELINAYYQLPTGKSLTFQDEGLFATIGRHNMSISSYDVTILEIIKKHNQTLYENEIMNDHISYSTNTYATSVHFDLGRRYDGDKLIKKFLIHNNKIALNKDFYGNEFNEEYFQFSTLHDVIPKSEVVEIFDIINQFKLELHDGIVFTSYANWEKEHTLEFVNTLTKMLRIA